MDEVVGVRRDFEGALEALDQAVREPVDESHRVGEQHRLAAGEGEAPRGRIERGEQAILGEHARIGEQVEQCRLAGVRVADDGDGCEPALAAALALQRSRLGELHEVGFELVDPPHDAPAIGLQLRLTATEPGADATALLRQAGLRTAPQPRQAVAEQSQLDLGLAFEGVGVLTEDVEDHRGPVDRRAAEQLLQVVLLGRGQFVVEHDGVGIDGEAELLQLLRLALADVPGVIGRVAPLHHPADLVGAGGVDEQREFVEAGIDVVIGVAGTGDRDEHDPFPDRPVDQRCGECLVVRRRHASSTSPVSSTWPARST